MVNPGGRENSARELNCSSNGGRILAPNAKGIKQKVGNYAPAEVAKNPFNEISPRLSVSVVNNLADFS